MASVEYRSEEWEFSQLGRHSRSLALFLRHSQGLCDQPGWALWYKVLTLYTYGKQYENYFHSQRGHEFARTCLQSLLGTRRSASSDDWSTSKRLTTTTWLRA
eukprot:11588765-Prorocentrum_lima.AAC.1